jgi:GH35 family endo-1,4-beta-xylanase
MKKKFLSTLLLAGALSVGSMQAQLSKNPNKFFGNITTSYNVDFGNGVPQFYKLWNQITCENESKWSSVEGSRGNFNWGGADNAFNYAKQHNFTYKFHALVWGAQYPSWLESLPAGERFSAMTNWFDHAKAKYETLPMIDVVNEAVGMHQAGNPMIKETLGGGGKTGYDWLIKAFEMAYERWPDAILIYNDYNSIRWDIDNYIALVQALRDAGAPIDAYGNQSHDVTDISESELKTALKKQQDALKMPMFITELDIDKASDAQQKSQYQVVLPAMWEADYCAGVTLWGYVLGKTWVDNSGLYKQNGEERPAMTWIKEYMETDAAKNAKGPFPGTKKEASIYIRPAALKVAMGDVLPIKVRAKMATKTIEKVELYANSDLIATMTEAPYITEYTAATTGKKTLKAVVTTTDGTTYERLSQIQVSRGTKRSPYNETVPELPGTIKAEEYDKGMSGVAYSNASRSTTTATKDGAWMEYTVDVKEDGIYNLEMEVASTNADGMFHLAEYTMDNLVFLTNITSVPKTGSSTKFQTLRCAIKEPLTAGRHVFTLLIDKGGFYVKNLTFKLTPTVSMPGIVEAEDFLNCDGAEVVTITDGYALGNVSAGGVVEYSMNVTQAGKYSYEATVSSEGTGSFSMVLIDSEGTEKTLGTVSVPNTGGKDTYQVKTGKIRNAIKDGKQTLRITIKSGNFNIDKINFICTDPATGIETLTDTAEDGVIYNLYGTKVGTGDMNSLPRGVYIMNGKKVVRK